MSSAGALGDSPFEWIVNSNALGVAFLSKEDDFRVSFLSRHAVRRLADGSLIGVTAEELMGTSVSDLADVPELRLESLRNPDNYPATARAIIEGRHLELAISSVTAEDDSYLGQ